MIEDVGIYTVISAIGDGGPITKIALEQGSSKISVNVVD